MTREEAIARIKDHMTVHKIEERAVKITEALNMAISALEQPEIVLCKDCVFGRLCFDVRNGIDTDSWVECTNPDGLYRDVSCEGYCSASIRRKGEQSTIDLEMEEV